MTTAVEVSLHNYITCTITLHKSTVHEHCKQICFAVYCLVSILKVILPSFQRLHMRSRENWRSQNRQIVSTCPINRSHVQEYGYDVMKW